MNKALIRETIRKNRNPGISGYQNPTAIEASLRHMVDAILAGARATVQATVDAAIFEGFFKSSTKMAEKATKEAADQIIKELKDGSIKDTQETLSSIEAKARKILETTESTIDTLHNAHKGQLRTDLDNTVKAIKEALAQALAKVNSLKPIAGKDADEEAIFARLTPLIPKEAIILEKVISAIPKTEALKPDSGTQIAEKLNTTKESVSMSVIRGLSDELTRLRAMIREIAVKKGAGKTTGGGMGNWVHERFATSSATTTVTIGAQAAANGNAILVRYQGQLLAHGVQYTISERVITLLFTPDDDTAVDATYVRT